MSVLWRFLPAVRRTEQGRFAFFATLNFTISAAQTIGLAGGEALFLAELGPSALPVAFIIASLSTVAVSLGYAALVGRMRNDSLLVGMLATAAVLLLAVLALGAGSRWMYFTLYCAFYLGQAIFINLHLWTFAADFFDTLSSKRLFPLFSVGSSIGGMLGGAISMLLSASFPAESLIVAWAVGLALAGVLVRAAASQLRRWTPVGQTEADESSVRGLASALRFIRRSPLALGLVFSVVGMVFSLFLMQYLYMDIFARSFATPGELAQFFGLYLALSNGLELVVGHSITPLLIRRFGVAQANLVHPLLTLLTFGLLFLDPRLHVAVIARANRELLNDSLAAPIRTLTFNALPYRLRGRLRAFIEGIVSFGAMSIAGAALLAVGTGVDWRLLVLAGASSALLYVGANLWARREYLRCLVGELRSGRLNLDDFESELGAGDVASLAERWERLLQQETGQPSYAMLQIAPHLAEQGFLEPLRRSAHHSHPRVRAACLSALASRPDEALVALLVEAIDDPSVEVRVAALEAAAAYDPCPAPLRAACRARLESPVPEVRALAARLLGEAGHATLRAMAAASDPAVAIAGLQALPVDLMDEALARSEAADPAVRAAALDTLTRAAGASPLDAEWLAAELGHASPLVRSAAVRAFGVRGDAERAPDLARALDDLARTVRDEAAAALGALGERAVDAISQPLGSPRMWTADAAIRALEATGSPRADTILAGAFRQRVEDAWLAAASIELLPREDQGLPVRFLAATLEAAQSRHCWVAFRLLETREDPAVVRSIRKALATGTARQRTDALELLSNLGDRTGSHLLALLLEESPLADTLPTVSSRLRIPRSFEDVLHESADSKSDWLRLAAEGVRALRSGLPVPEEPLMEGLLALRRVSLFAGLSFEQLEAIKRVMKELQYVRGEAVVSEGDTGEDLFVLLEGEAQAYKSYGTPEQLYLSTFTPVSYFGEIAILDSAPRSATVVTTKDSRLLSLDGQRFRELILQAPEISFEVFRVLTARIRAAEAR